MEATPQHTYQVLTKRSRHLIDLAEQLRWPPNLWLGGKHRRRPLRIPGAAPGHGRCDAEVLSIEPLLGPVPSLLLDGIGWVIVGGESGPNARPADPARVTDIRDRCQAADVPFFFKQWGGRTPKAGDCELDGRIWDEMPATAPAGAPDVALDGDADEGMRLFDLGAVEAEWAKMQDRIVVPIPKYSVDDARTFAGWTAHKLDLRRVYLTQYRKVAGNGTYIDGFGGEGRIVVEAKNAPARWP